MPVPPAEEDGLAFVRDMMDAERAAATAVAHWMSFISEVQDHRHQIALLMPAFATALGRATAIAQRSAGKPGSISIFEDSMLAYFRWGYRGAAGPVEQDGSPWVGIHGQA